MPHFHNAGKGDKMSKKSRYKGWGDFVVTLDAGSETEAEDKVQEWFDSAEEHGLEVMSGSIKTTDLHYEPKGDDDG